MRSRSGVLIRYFHCCFTDKSDILILPINSCAFQRRIHLKKTKVICEKTVIA